MGSSVTSSSGNDGFIGGSGYAVCSHSQLFCKYMYFLLLTSMSPGGHFWCFVMLGGS